MNKFSIEENGYNKQEVNQFIDDVIKNTEDIMKRAKAQQNEIFALQNELESYKKKETDIENMTRKAKENASMIIEEALNRCERIEKQIEMLEEKLTAIKKDIDN